MKFLTINGKLQIDANGKVITIPEINTQTEISTQADIGPVEPGYKETLIKLNEKLLKHDKNLVKIITNASNTITFKIKVENCPDFMEDTEDIITANIGDKLENITEQSAIIQAMTTGEAGAYEYITDVEGYDTTIFTINGDSNADAAYFAALRPDDIITASWDNQIYYVVEAH